jgi:DNA-binding NarL/FixJ family response regulator
VLVVALVSDLMDRSRLTAAIEGVSFARSVLECTTAERAAADVVIVDLARFASAVGELRRALPNARIVAFGPHVDEAAATAAAAAGADLVWPRSRFFRDPAAALRGIPGPT